MSSLSRREFIKGAALGSVLATPLGHLVRRTGSTPAIQGGTASPNLILITIDALRADHLSCYGYAEATSPNIDRLASEGVQFMNAVSTAPWTFPSFAALHTSMYPSELGISAFNLPLSQIGLQRLDLQRVTLAERLRQDGYRTQAVVTNPWLYPEFGFSQGFDGYLAVDRQRAYDYDAILKTTLAGQLAGRLGPAESLLRTLYEALMGPSGQPTWEVRGDRVTDEALNWLEGHAGGPFFLWLHYIDPHYPFSPPAAFRPSDTDVSPDRLDYLASYNEDDIYTGRARLRPADRQAIVSLYDGEIRYVDEHVGRLLDALDDLGLRENSLVALTADHGEEFWEHGGFQHGHNLYNELVHVPLILRGPGLAPRQVNEVVRHVDIAPTLVDAAGSSFHADAHGMSLLQLLAGSASLPAAYSEGLFLTSEKKAVRMDSHKLILHPFTDTCELYDLEADPAEKENLADHDEPTLQTMKDELDAWRTANEARFAALPRSAAQGESDQALLDALRAGGY